MQPNHREGLLTRRQHSQSMVEFSLSLIALIMLMSGMLDLGRLFFIFTAMEDIAGEGALYLSIDPGCNTSSSTAGNQSCADPNNALFRMSKAGSGVIGFDTYYNGLTAPQRLALLVSTVPVVGTNLSENQFRIRMCYRPDYDVNDYLAVTSSECPTASALGPSSYDSGTGTWIAEDMETQDVVYVELHYGYKLLTPFMPAIAGINPLRLTVSAVQYTVLK